MMAAAWILLQRSSDCVDPAVSGEQATLAPLSTTCTTQTEWFASKNSGKTAMEIRSLWGLLFLIACCLCLQSTKAFAQQFPCKVQTPVFPLTATSKNLCAPISAEKPYWIGSILGSPGSVTPQFQSSGEVITNAISAPLVPTPTELCQPALHQTFREYTWDQERYLERWAFWPTNPVSHLCESEPTYLDVSKVIRARCPSGFQWMNPSLYGFPYSVDSTPDPRAQNFQNGYACVKVTPPKYPKCCQGNPVETIGGAKTQRDTDFVAPNGKLALIRHYRSDNLDGPAFLGNGWSVEGLHRLDLRMFTDGSVTLNLGSGEYKFFSSADGVTWQTDRHELDHLVALSPSGGVPSGWIYYSEDQQSLNQFDSLGKLTKTTFVDGSELSFTYQANGTIQTISDQTGRTISFAYSGEGLVGSVQTPDGTITYEYSAPIDFTTTAADRNLVAVSYPGSTSVHYLYGESSNISGNDPWLVSGRHFLTGRIDEKGVRVGTYKYLFEYDDYTKTTSARAISTEGAGGVNRFSFARQLLSG